MVLIERIFILQEIFEDGNASHIQFLPFKQKQHSVIVTWYNKTLSTDKCPQDQISKLESIMKNEDRGISNRVHAIMEPEFQVSTIKVLPISNCKVHKPKYHVPKMPDERINIDESSQTTSTSSSDEYLLTFIVPVVVISIMTLFAILAACILYRRRRTGKMNVLEEGDSKIFFDFYCSICYRSKYSWTILLFQKKNLILISVQDERIMEIKEFQ